jgi:hypothetical protein
MVFYAGQFKVQTVHSEGELIMIKAKAVKDRCLEIVHVNRVLDDIETELIGLAVLNARFDTATGHPHSEGLGMVITPLAATKGSTGFHHWGSPKFTTPYDQGVFEHTSLFQV